MKYFVSSDVHSYFDLLQDALNTYGFDPQNDTFILIGDAFDRGEQPIALFQWLESLPHLVHILGNHDAMTLEFLKNPYHDRVGFDCSFNGNKITLQKFAQVTDEEFDDLLYKSPDVIKEKIMCNYPTLFSYLEALPSYFELESAIFVHAGFSLEINDWRASSFHEFCWNRNFFWDQNNCRKHIYLGHTPANKLRKKANELGIPVPVNNDPFTYENKTGIDGGVCYPGGQINIIVIEE